MSACGSRISMPCTACTSKCCEGCSPEIRPHAPPAEDERPDQHPRRHGEAEESPADLAALPAPGEHLADDLPQRRVLQEHRERGATGRQGTGRQTLDIE